MNMKKTTLSIIACSLLSCSAFGAVELRDIPAIPVMTTPTGDVGDLLQGSNAQVYGTFGTSVLTSTTALLTWTPSIYAESQSVYKSTDGGTTYSLVSGVTPECTTMMGVKQCGAMITGLSASTAYKFKIKITSGNIGWYSDIASATTTAAGAAPVVSGGGGDSGYVPAEVAAAAANGNGA